MSNTDKILLTIAKILSVGLLQLCMSNTNDKSVMKEMENETERLINRLKASLTD